MEPVDLVVNKKKVFAKLENNVPLALLRLIYLIHAGGNSDSIFINKLYYLYDVSFLTKPIDSVQVLVTPPFDINKNLRKMLILLSKNQFINLEAKPGKIKVSLTDTGKSIVNEINEDQFFKDYFSSVRQVVSKITDVDLKKQQLIW